ncbi:tape measure protein [uncultured Microbacterium sp.]|uniref:phage tail protein n=1 Tax=uncultured Microbacterium sp. TaxID=191216 RepID=UPI0025D08BD8|nr:tape measure protein [uncultured Microbacterium sp.]
MALDLGTLVAKVRVDDDDFDKKTSGWSQKGAGIASAFGNLAADAISQASNMLVDFVGDAAEASDATDKFRKTLDFSGLSTSAIDALTASTQAYADATVYSLGDIQNITAQLASNGVQGPDELAKALGNLNAVAGGNAETFGRVGSVLTQTTSLGQLNTENWRQMAEAIPGATGAVKDALAQAGAYTGNFEQALSEGQITAEEFNAALMTVGTDPIAVEAAKSTETFEGAAGNLSATIQGKLVEALNMVKGPITDFQNGLSWFIDNIAQFTPLLAGLGAAILVAVAPAIWAAVTATWAWTAALLANPITWIVLAVGALVAAIVWLVMNWDTAVAWVTEVWGGFVDWITGVIDGFVAWWNGIWAAVGAWITSVWEGFVGFVSDVFRNFMLGIQIIGNAIASWWNGLWSGIGSFFTDLWTNIVNFVQGVIQGYVSFVMGIFNGFLGFWNGLWTNVGNFFRTTWDGALAFVRGIPQAIFDVFTGAATWLYDIGKNIVQGLWNGLKAIWESVSSWFQDTFGGIIDTVAGIFGIHSPSRVFSEFGVFIGEGLIEGLAKIQPDVENAFTDMERVPSTGGWNSAGADAPVSGGNTRNITVQMFEPQHPDTEEALYHALGSPRVRD